MKESKYMEIGVGRSKFFVKKLSYESIRNFRNSLTFNNMTFHGYQCKIIDDLAKIYNASELTDREVDVIYEAFIRQHPDLEYENIILDIRDKAEDLLTMHMVQEISPAKRNKLDNLSNQLKSKIVGQDKCIDQLVDSIIVKETCIIGEDNPKNYFLSGPSGVGKTETVKIISDLLGLPSMIINCQDYQLSHEVSKLRGAPPGYIGYEGSGNIAKFISKNPKSIILCDEIEKAHNSFFDAILGLMEGSYQDTKSNTYPFVGYLFFTSNIGNDFSSNYKTIGFNSESKDSVRSKKIDDSYKERFSPPFLGRISKSLQYQVISKDSLKIILSNYIDDVTEQLLVKNINIVLTNKCLNHLVEIGSSEDLGVRYIKNKFESEILEKIGLSKLKYPKKNKFKVDLKDDNFVVV